MTSIQVDDTSHLLGYQQQDERSSSRRTRTYVEETGGGGGGHKTCPTCKGTGKVDKGIKSPPV